MADDKSPHRCRHRHRHHRSRMGRHSRAEQAAAALVAVAVLHHHHLGDRLLDRLSGLAADDRRSTQGVLGWHSRSAVVADLEELQGAARADVRQAADGLAAEIAADPALARFCPRGRAARPSPTIARPVTAPAAAAPRAIPNLNDDDWLWGGKLDRHRADHPLRHPLRRPARPRAATCRISAATACSSPTRSPRSRTYVRSLSGLPVDRRADLARGKKIFADNCAVCHGPDGKGKRELGAPNLTDAIWLYGSDKATIIETITNGRGGVMPAWAGRLDDTTIKALAVYVHSASAAAKNDPWPQCSTLRPRPPAGTPMRPVCARAEREVRPELKAVAEPPSLVPQAEPGHEWDDEPLYEARRKIYPQSVQGLIAGSNGSCCCHARHLLRRCRSSAGTAARTRPTRRCWSICRAGASTSSSSRSGRRKSTTSPAC